MRGDSKKRIEVMAEVLVFSRNRCTSVEQLDEQTLKARCRIQDTLTDACVDLTVKLPDLVITGIEAEIFRTHEAPCREALDDLQKIRGVRIGPGMVKIIKGLVGQKAYWGQGAFMIEECCQAVIISFTKDVLDRTPGDEKEAKIFLRKMARENIRLVNSCIAFAPGSPFLEGPEPEEGE